MPSDCSAAAPSLAAVPVATGGFGPRDLALFAVVVVAWSTAWYALKLQLGVVPPMQSLAWRFGLSALAMGAMAWFQGESLVFSAREHLRLFATGALFYAGCFGLFYYGSADLPSGLVSVIFSLASLGNLVLAWALWGEPISRRVLLGGLLGAVGVAALFAPVIGPALSGAGGLGAGAMIAVGIDLVATASFCVGNLVSQKMMEESPRVAALNTWAMGYGTLCFVAVALLEGKPWTFDFSPVFLGSFAWLTGVATVLAYWAYTRLSGSVGAARAGYAAVTSPLIALVISTVLEGYAWTPIALVGLVLVSVGNVVVLRR